MTYRTSYNHKYIIGIIRMDCCNGIIEGGSHCPVRSPTEVITESGSQLQLLCTPISDVAHVRSKQS
jgi:hypothetical protein